MMTSNKPLLNIGAMARRLGVKAQWLRSEAEAGGVPAVKTGDSFLFDAVTVERILRARARRGDQRKAGDGHA